MTKKRSGEPWMPGDEYGRSLPAFTVNLIVQDVAQALPFYRDVLQADVRYSDPDFAALRLAGVDVMLHADHTYEDHPWHERLAGGDGRGVGAELRLFGVNPDLVEKRAKAAGAQVLRAAADKAHGWREAWVQDADGYVWAVGTPTEPRE